MADLSFSTNMQHLSPGNTLFILGSELSMAAGLPGWVDLARFLAKRTGYNLPPSDGEITRDHILKALESYANSEHRHELLRQIREQIGRTDIKPTPLHELIAKVADKLQAPIFCVYYDDLIEKALQNLGIKYATVVDQKELALPHGVSVVKMLGEWQQRNRIVITPNDFNVYAKTHSELLGKITSELQTKTPLILGCAPNDPFFTIFDPVWDSIEMYFGSLRRPGYGVMFNSISEFELESFRKRNIEIISLPSEPPMTPLEEILHTFLETEAGESTQIENPNGWLPSRFKSPPFAALRAEDDVNLSRYYLALPDFERIRDRATGSVFVFAESGGGKTAMACMIKEICDGTLSDSSSYGRRVMAVPFSDFTYLTLLEHNSANTEIHICKLLETIVRRLCEIVEEHSSVKRELTGDKLAEFSFFREKYLKRASGAGIISRESNTTLISECQRLERLINALTINHIYILVDRIEDFCSDIVGVDFITALISFSSLLDLFSFKFFVPETYRDLLHDRDELEKRMDQIASIPTKWKNDQLQAMLSERLRKTTDGEISLFRDLIDFSDLTAIFDVDQILVKYAYGSPRDLILLSSEIIRFHMNTQMNAAQNLIKPGTFIKALLSFSKERASRLYGDELIKQITKISRYPISLDALLMVLEDLRFVEKAESKGLICKSLSPRGKLVYEIPDPRVRLLCPACKEDQVLSSH